MENKIKRNFRKFLVGNVVKKSGDKTIKVACFYKVPHSVYQKEVKRKTVIYVHDKDNKCAVGDSVRVFETRPLSRLKRWRVGNIIGTTSNIDV
ncbi:MAG: 30S ribosomal protein S17 [Puniceicoccales bacterium]|jgi:small subunit ribosomal protein S17|nr:30S ribosomal protein S17 [Puniceicoccales bacterium]